VLYYYIFVRVMLILSWLIFFWKWNNFSLSQFFTFSTFSWRCSDVFRKESSSKALPCKVIDSEQCTSDNKLENSKTFKQWNLFKKCTLLIQ
jgi:hypothetical protein